MKTANRKAAITAYKEREVRAGIFALRCAETGQAWVGRAPNVDGIENRVRFTLGVGSHRSASLQTAWKKYSDVGLDFEVLEALDPDLTPYVRDARLKERLAHWAAALNADTI